MKLKKENEYLPSHTSLPDLDDESMSYVFEYMEYYHLDLFWSFLSDFCFLLGSILYLCLAYLDFIGSEPFYYYLLDFAAPLSFLANSAVDVMWSLVVQHRQRVKKAMKYSFELSLQDQQSMEEHTPKWWQRVRKHAGHRRSLYAAATFGIAACLSVIAVLLTYMKEETSNSSAVLNGASDHMYVVSALIAITGKRTRPFFFANDKRRFGVLREPESLEDIGDFLFLIGSLLDALLDDIQMEGFVE